MSSYKKRRRKLAAHDQGIDRHSKSVSYENKQVRLTDDHNRQVSQRRKKRK